MHTEPEIICSNNQQRGYVKVYINGERHRFYNGKVLGISCNPNHTKNFKDKQKALTTLAYELKKKLEAGWLPNQEEKTTVSSTKQTIPAGEAFFEVLQELALSDLSELYKRDIRWVGEAFHQYLKNSGLGLLPVSTIDSGHVENFLKQYRHSSAYYMNKRRTLGGIFARLLKQKLVFANPVYETSTLSEKATLHKAYTKPQLTKVLAHLKKDHPKLHLCALLMYGCFLRPHQEIRVLCRHHINEDITRIVLGGDENKGGRIRTVLLPNYVREEMYRQKVDGLRESDNLFSGSINHYNGDYFKRAWARAKLPLLEEGTIDEKHTLYSFRHTAAINLYMKTKDLYKVQQAMAHSSMTVTLTYMRSLGIMNSLTENDMPEL